jgi:hypothetical protein
LELLEDLIPIVGESQSSSASMFWYPC